MFQLNDLAGSPDSFVEFEAYTGAQWRVQWRRKKWIATGPETVRLREKDFHRCVTAGIGCTVSAVGLADVIDVTAV